MILLWVTLLVLHQGYALVPVNTVRLGEPATFTCALHYKETGRPQLDWYKQSAGETLKLIVTKRESTKPEYAPEFSESRMKINNDNNFSNLTILRTIQEDEGMYHCASTERYTSPVWSGTYLLIKGNTQRTSNYTVVQWPTVSDPVLPGDSVTLQCSVLSVSGNKMCPGDDSVFWFRAGSNKSFYLNLLFFPFDNIAGTSVWSHKANTIIFLVISAISLIVTAFLIYAIQRNNAVAARQKHSGGQKILQRNEDRSIYSAVVFTVMKTGSGAIKDSKAAERQRSYAAVKAFGLD